MVLIAPNIGIREKQQVKLYSILPLARFLKIFMPLYIIKIKPPSDMPWLIKFTKVIYNVNTPLLMILVKADTMVCNDTAKKALEIFTAKDKTMIQR